MCLRCVFISAFVFFANFISVIPAMSVFQQMFLFIRNISYCSNSSFFRKFLFPHFFRRFTTFLQFVYFPADFFNFLHNCFIYADIFAKLFISADFLFRNSLYLRIVSQDFLFQQIFWRAFLVSEDFLILLSQLFGFRRFLLFFANRFCSSDFFHFSRFF